LSQRGHYNHSSTPHPLNQTRKWLSLTTSLGAQPNKKVATPSQVVGDTTIQKTHPLNQTAPKVALKSKKKTKVAIPKEVVMSLDYLLRQYFQLEYRSF
jgi:hypothetical protein